MLCCNGVESEKVRRQIGASWFAPVLYSAPSRPDAQIPFRKASDGFVSMRIAALRFAYVRFLSFIEKTKIVCATQRILANNSIRSSHFVTDSQHIVPLRLLFIVFQLCNKCSNIFAPIGVLTYGRIHAAQPCE